MKLDVTQTSQHFRQMKRKMAARMNTALLVFWCSASTSKSFHYYYSIPKSNHYCCYNQVKRTYSQIQWWSILVMWFLCWGSAHKECFSTFISALSAFAEDAQPCYSFSYHSLILNLIVSNIQYGNTIQKDMISASLALFKLYEWLLLRVWCSCSGKPCFKYLTVLRNQATIITTLENSENLIDSHEFNVAKSFKTSDPAVYLIIKTCAIAIQFYIKHPSATQPSLIVNSEKATLSYSFINY